MVDPTDINQKLIYVMEARVNAGASIHNLGFFTEVLTRVDALTAMQLDRDELGDDQQWYDTWDNTLHRHTAYLEGKRQQWLDDKHANKFGSKYFESLYADVVAYRYNVTVTFRKLRAIPRMLAFIHTPTDDEMLQCAQEVYATTFNQSLVRHRVPEQTNCPVQTRLRWFSGKFNEAPTEVTVQTYSTRRL